MPVDSESRNVGSRIAARRAELGYSLSEVAARMEPPLHPTAVYAWENGRNLAAVVRFARLCRVLGVSADDLLGLERGAS